MHYVIIGGDAAGMSAAMQLVRFGDKPEITVLEKTDQYSYAQCGLPYVLGGIVDSTDTLVARTREEFRDRYGINALAYHEALSVNPGQRTVDGRRLDTDESFSFRYDKLLVAAGASPVVPDIPGIHLAGVHTVKTIPETQTIRRRLQQARSIAIIGGGYIGLEVAENLVHIGKEVRIFEQGSHLARNFDPEMSQRILHEAQQNGISVHLDAQVCALHGEDAVEQVVTADGRFPADLVIVAVGVTPNTKMLGPEFAKHPTGAAAVDKHLETSVPGVFAAGDCAVQYHRIKQADDYVPLGTTANKQGQLAALNMLGTKAPFGGIVGTAIFRFFDLTAARTGLTQQEAAASNRPAAVVEHKTRAKAGYMPEAGTLELHLVYDPSTRQLLGAQAVGSGADKRIDVLSTALYSGLTIDQLMELDLAYAPPYNGVWDPIQQTARKAPRKAT